MGSSHSKDKQYPKLDERKSGSVDSRSTHDKGPARSSKHYSKIAEGDGKGKGKKKGVYMDPRGREPGEKAALPWAPKFSFAI